MGVALKKAKPAAAAKAPAKNEGAKVGVDYLAKALGVTPFTIRVKLRALEIEKSGRSYEFTKAEADKIVKKMEAMSATAE